MAKITTGITCKTYGVGLAFLVAQALHGLGFSEESATRAGMWFVLPRTEAGNRSGWALAGRRRGVA